VSRCNLAHMTQPILINGEAPNLFCGLLSYRVRADRDSRENFLTESFAYVLAVDPRAAVQIIQAFVGKHFVVAELVGIRTQVSLNDESGLSLPDLMLEVRDTRNRAFEVWIENKWDSFADANQLTTYMRKLAVRSRDTPKHLVLLTPRCSDAQVAELCMVKKSPVSLSHMSWSKIHEVVTSHCAHAITREFELFLSEHRLGLVGISLDEALAHLKMQQHKRVPVEHPFRRKLKSLCDRLLADLDPASPLSEGGYTHDAYGRVGIWTFHQKITLGFLYDPKDHGTEFLDQTRPLDIVVRIEGALERKAANLLRPKMASLAKRLEKAGFACDNGRWRSNKHTTLLGQYRPGFPFELSSLEQYLRVLDIFRSTLKLIAEDAQAMAVLQRMPGHS
jgi:hypothetical protein